jgi:hypothetical protein
MFTFARFTFAKFGVPRFATAGFIRAKFTPASMVRALSIGSLANVIATSSPSPHHPPFPACVANICAQAARALLKALFAVTQDYD